jgi:hypothetical protein
LRWRYEPGAGEKATRCRRVRARPSYAACSRYCNAENVQLVLTRYAIERLLYRLSVSPHRDRFILKGEALVAFNDGVPWWPDAEFERTHITPQQAERYEADPGRNQFERI